MDKGTALQALAAWPLQERIEFLQEAWDEVVDSGWQPELTPELKSELDRRIAAADANPDQVVTWESILEHVRRRR